MKKLLTAQELLTSLLKRLLTAEELLASFLRRLLTAEELLTSFLKRLLTAQELLASFLKKLLTAQEYSPLVRRHRCQRLRQESACSPGHREGRVLPLLWPRASDHGTPRQCPGDESDTYDYKVEKNAIY